MKTPSTMTRASSRARNNGFIESHRQMLEVAVRLIAESGVEALSMAALARELKVNRTTIYYHFRNREQLIEEVKRWASEQLSTGLDLNLSQQERINYITRFVLENPELVKLWIEDLISGKDIRHSYPAWDKLVSGTREKFDATVDVEIYCLTMLVSAFIAPGIFRNCIAPELSIDSIVARFEAEHRRNLQLQNLS